MPLIRAVTRSAHLTHRISSGLSLRVSVSVLSPAESYALRTRCVCVCECGVFKELGIPSVHQCKCVIPLTSHELIRFRTML